MSVTPTAPTVQWSRYREAVGLVVSGATFGAAWRIALVVGALLTTVNQGGVLLAGEATTTTWFRVVANLAIPYVVASCGFLGACRVDTASGSAAPQVNGSPSP